MPSLPKDVQIKRLKYQLQLSRYMNDRLREENARIEEDARWLREVLRGLPVYRKEGE